MSLNTIGHESLRAFVKTTQTVISEAPYDHIIAASDSGQLANHITSEVYDALGQETPPAIIAPIYRHVDTERTVVFDNTTLAPDFKTWQDKELGSTLFVDDEIWRGNTLNGMLDLLFALHVKIDDLTVVAENGGFEYGNTLRDIPLCYVPPKSRVPEVYNAMSYTLPPDFHEPVYTILDEPTLNHKQVMCTLLGLPIKDRPNGKPQFSTHLIERAQANLSDFSILQHGYRAWLRSTVQDYMD